MPLDTEPIRARLAKATPGPWCRHMIPGGDSIDGPDGTFDPTGEIMPAWDDGEHDCAIARGVYDGDAELIAHAPTDIAALLSEVDRLTAENEGLYAELDDTKAALEDVELECDNMRNRLNDLDIDY